jgi:uncharacterized protein (DUF362 family)
MKRKEIALIKETRQKQFVKKIMDAISPYISLKSCHRVAIKINLSGSREIYANTHYETVESLIFYLKDQYGISDISVIEGSDGAYFSGRTTWDIFYKFRYKEVELNGARLVNLDEMPHEQTLKVDTVSGEREVHFTTFDTDYMISVVPPKTHNIFPVFLSIPNIIGFVKPEERVLMFGASRSEIRKINFSTNPQYFQLIDNSGKNFSRLLTKISPSMVIIDGLHGMEGRGPIKGSPVFHGFAIASEDPVLADSLATYVMGFEVNEVSYLHYAFNEGLGNNRWQNVIGVDPPQVKFPYRPHPLHHKQRSWRSHLQRKNRGNREKRENRLPENQEKE